MRVLVKGWNRGGRSGSRGSSRRGRNIRSSSHHVCNLEKIHFGATSYEFADGARVTVTCSLLMFKFKFTNNEKKTKNEMKFVFVLCTYPANWSVAVFALVMNVAASLYEKRER